eukprot:3350017-Alexandrium_andersonii.AAC.1
MSSSRAELAAAILAVAAGVRTHLGTDSQNLVDTFSKWGRGCLALKKKPWPLRPNGDIWALLCRALQRSPERVLRISE